MCFWTLRDAVAPADKPKARKNAIEALRDIDWRGNGKTVSVRINSLDTHYMYRDVVDLIEQAGDKVDTLLIPKAGVAADIYMVDAILTQIEHAMGYENKVGIEALIETTLGMANVDDIARASTRMEALHFGVADYAASCRARTVDIGGLNPNYPGDQWHYDLSRMLVTCRAYGIRAIDGPFGDIKDPDNFMLAARRAATLGYEANGPFTRHKLTWPTMYFPPHPQRSSTPRLYCRHWSKPPPKAREPRSLTGA